MVLEKIIMCHNSDVIIFDLLTYYVCRYSLNAHVFDGYDLNFNFILIFAVLEL